MAKEVVQIPIVLPIVLVAQLVHILLLFLGPGLEPLAPVPAPPASRQYASEPRGRAPQSNPAAPDLDVEPPHAGGPRRGAPGAPGVGEGRQRGPPAAKPKRRREEVGFHAGDVAGEVRGGVRVREGERLREVG